MTDAERREHRRLALKWTAGTLTDREARICAELDRRAAVEARNDRRMTASLEERT